MTDEKRQEFIFKFGEVTGCMSKKEYQEYFTEREVEPEVIRIWQEATRLMSRAFYLEYKEKKDAT